MSKIIAVLGSPNSGKTTLSVKLAEYIYRVYKASAIVVLRITIFLLCPSCLPEIKISDIQSVGNTLSKMEITENEVLKNISIIRRNYAQ